MFSCVDKKAHCQPPRSLRIIVGNSTTPLGLDLWLLFAAVAYRQNPTIFRQVPD